MNRFNLKSKKVVLLLLLLMFGIASCNQNNKNINVQKENADANIILKDYGPEPLVLDLETYTETNNNFRTALWTGTNLQLTLMSIPIGCEIGLEMHPDTDQFIRIEEGNAQILIGDSKDSLQLNQIANDGFAIIIPAGKWHNIINTGDKPLKVYSIYSPAEHPHSTIHKTFEEAEEAETKQGD